MAFRDESPIDVYWDLSSKFRFLCFEESGSSAWLGESEVFVVQNLCDRERVVYLRNIYIVRTYSRHIVCGFSCVLRDLETGQWTLTSSERHGARCETQTGNPYGSIGQLAGFLCVCDDEACCAIRVWAAVEEFQRGGHGSRFEDFLSADGFLEHGVRVFHSIFSVFHRDKRHLLLCGSMLCHVGGRVHRVVCGHCCPEGRLPHDVPCSAHEFLNLLRREFSHFLHPHNCDHIMEF